MVGIIINGARALEYLHEHCNPPVVHRDLKSSNILLDSNFSAKVRSIRDLLTLACTIFWFFVMFTMMLSPLLRFYLNQLSNFGLAVTSGTENKNVKLSGTLGYAAPEYLLDGMQNNIWLPNCILIDHWFE